MQRAVRVLQLASLAGLLVVRAATGGDVKIDGKFISTASSGPPIEVSSSDLVTGLNADLLDGLSASELVSGVHHVVVVAKSGGQFSSIQAAINSISGVAESNRFLVWVGPGIYDEEVSVSSEWIALEGAGQHSTVIRSDGSPGTITGASIVHNLTVEADGDGDGVVGIGVCASCRAEIAQVTVDVTTSVPNPGIEYGATGILCLSCSSMELSDVEVSARSTNANGLIWGVYASASESIRLRHVMALAHGGLRASALIVSADGTGLEASEWAVSLENVDAHTSGGTGEFGAYVQGDPTNLPRMRIVRTTTSADSDTGNGLYVEYGDATLDNVVSTVDGGTGQIAAGFNYGTSEVFQSRFRNPGAAAPETAISLGSAADVTIVYSQIVGTFDTNAGFQLSCRGNYDDTLSDVTCP